MFLHENEYCIRRVDIPALLYPKTDRRNLDEQTMDKKDMRNLYVAKVWHIEYGNAQTDHADAQTVFFQIFELFGLDASAESPYDNEYEISRKALQGLLRAIVMREELFEANKQELSKKLKEIDMELDEFTAILSHLIRESEPEDSQVHLSWF